jgi:hypothetical protein
MFFIAEDGRKNKRGGYEKTSVYISCCFSGNALLYAQWLRHGIGEIYSECC